MSEKGIIMSQPNVLALLAKRKYRTMRLIKEVQSIPFDKISPVMNKPPHQHDDGRWYYELQQTVDSTKHYKLKPRYSVGDRLYVKETFCVCDNILIDKKHPCYRASFDETTPKVCESMIKWRPSIFMSKKYARIWMTCTKVTVQRPQELSIEDMINEGLINSERIIFDWKNLYISIYGLEKWKQNLWHFVYHWQEIEIKD